MDKMRIQSKRKNASQLGTHFRKWGVFEITISVSAPRYYNIRAMAASLPSPPFLSFPRYERLLRIGKEIPVPRQMVPSLQWWLPSGLLQRVNALSVAEISFTPFFWYRSFNARSFVCSTNCLKSIRTRVAIVR